MTPVTSIQEKPSGTPPARLVAPASSPASRLTRLGITAGLVVGFFAFREELKFRLVDLWLSLAGQPMAPNVAAAWLVAALLVGLVALWFDVLRRDKRFYAPLLITSILLMGDAAFGILDNHSSPPLARLTGGYVQTISPTFLAILTAIAAEMLLGRTYFGKWPHLASAYVSGISAGILIKSPATWPFVFCALISITSKYVLRIGDRHLWNPTNLGMTAMLLLAPQHAASLSVQAGNEIWPVAIIWILGGLILWQLGRLHIPVAFIAAFVPLSILRAWVTGNLIGTELAPLTTPMFQLYIFFMITDPKSTTRTWRRQVVVAIAVAVMETFLRLAFRDVYSLYHALFIVGPVSNLIEIVMEPSKPQAAGHSPQRAGSVSDGNFGPTVANASGSFQQG
jgi:hypothetical protein